VQWARHSLASVFFSDPRNLRDNSGPTLLSGGTQRQLSACLCNKSEPRGLLGLRALSWVTTGNAYASYIAGGAFVFSQHEDNNVSGSRSQFLGITRLFVQGLSGKPPAGRDSDCKKIAVWRLDVFGAIYSRKIMTGVSYTGTPTSENPQGG